MTAGKKARGGSSPKGRDPDARAVRGAAALCAPSPPEKQRREAVTDRDYQVWRDELL